MKHLSPKQRTIPKVWTMFWWSTFSLMGHNVVYCWMSTHQEESICIMASFGNVLVNTTWIETLVNTTTVGMFLFIVAKYVIHCCKYCCFVRGKGWGWRYAVWAHGDSSIGSQLTWQTLEIVVYRLTLSLLPCRIILVIDFCTLHCVKHADFFLLFKRSHWQSYD